MTIYTWSSDVSRTADSVSFLFNSEKILCASNDFGRLQNTASSSSYSWMLFVVLHHHSVNIVRTLCHKNLKCCLKGFTWLFGCYPAFEQHKTNTTFYWIIKVSKTWTRRFYSPTWNSVCHNFATTSHSWSILRKNFCVLHLYLYSRQYFWEGTAGHSQRSWHLSHFIYNQRFFL